MAREDLLGVVGDRRGLVAREIGIVGFAALGYFGGRLIVEGDRESAFANADRIMSFERWLGIDIEQSAQDLVVEHDVLRVLGNLSYVWLHWPLLIAVLVVLFVRDHPVYLRLRRALVASGLVGLTLFWLLPTAPPRFLPGFEGTVSDAARRHYLPYPLSWANPYAAFPSFHAGWTLIACLALAASMRSVRARVVALVPALLVGLSVVTTGNHYVVDAVAGVVIAVTAYAVAGRFARARRTGQESGADVAVPQGTDRPVPCTPSRRTILRTGRKRPCRTTSLPRPRRSGGRSTRPTATRCSGTTTPSPRRVRMTRPSQSGGTSHPRPRRPSP